MGRKRSLDHSQEQQVLALRYSGKKTPEIAEQYKVCPRTIDRILRTHNVPLKRGRLLHEHYSCFATYLNTHPNTKLPRGLKAIAALTGCGQDSIKMYLYRLRRELRHKAGAIDFLEHSSWKYRNSKGHIIPARAISSYKVRVESWTHAVCLDCVLKGGAKTTVRLSADLVRRLYLSVVNTDKSSPASDNQGVVGVPPVNE